MNRPWRAAASKARAAVRRLLSSELQSASFPVGKPIVGGFIDFVTVDPAGIISIQGWSETSFDAGNRSRCVAGCDRRARSCARLEPAART